MNVRIASLNTAGATGPQRWRLPVAALLVLAGLGGAWTGGWLGLLGGLGLLLGLALGGSRAPAQPAHTQGTSEGTGEGNSEGDSEGQTTDATPATAAPSTRAEHVTAPAIGTRVPTGQAGHAKLGAELMVGQVVPVWRRQLEVSRDAGSDGLAQLLQSFSEIDGALQSLSSNLSTFKVTAEPGAVDDAVRTRSAALQALTAASRRAFDDRDAAVAELGRCADGLSELQHLAKQMRELSRHTRLVAFNASIESKRVGQTSTHSAQQAGGTQAVATELRMLAGRIGETAEQTERVVSRLAGAVRRARREGEMGDASDEELRLEIDLNAREALNQLLATIGASVQSGGEVQQAAAQLGVQLESIYVQFQFGDRVSQMLSIVASDMDHFAEWIKDHPNANHSDAANWLEALDASYTMEEQRATHHGNVHVNQGAAVEFF